MTDEAQWLDPPPLPGWLKTCAYCQWWAPEDFDEWTETWLAKQRPPWGECRLTRTHDAAPAPAATWEREPDGAVEARANTKAIAKDASGYAAVLVTAPDFGCVQWQLGNVTGVDEGDDPGDMPAAP